MASQALPSTFLHSVAVQDSSDLLHPASLPPYQATRRCSSSCRHDSLNQRRLSEEWGDRSFLAVPCNSASKRHSLSLPPGTCSACSTLPGETPLSFRPSPGTRLQLKPAGAAPATRTYSHSAPSPAARASSDAEVQRTQVPLRSASSARHHAAVLRHMDTGAALASGAAAVAAISASRAPVPGDSAHVSSSAGRQLHHTVLAGEAPAAAGAEALRGVEHGLEGAVAGVGSSRSFLSNDLGEASLSQALLRRTASATATAKAGVVQPLLRSRMVKGPGGGLLMVAALTLAGLVTVLKSSTYEHQHVDGEEVCSECEGYGVCRCSLCDGRGSVIWEGKLLRNDPCPACVGDCSEKCSACGGARRRKGAPPHLQM